MKFMCNIPFVGINAGDMAKFIYRFARNCVPNQVYNLAFPTVDSAALPSSLTLPTFALGGLGINSAERCTLMFSF